MIISPAGSTYRQTASLRVALVIIFAIPIVIMAAMAFDTTPPSTALLGVAGGLVGVLIALCVAIGKTVVTIHQEGVRRVSIFGTTDIEWKDVREYRYRVAPVYHGGGLLGAIIIAALSRGRRGVNLFFTLIANDGRKLKIDSNFKNADEAIGQILARIHPALQQKVDQTIDRGGAVFGNVKLSRRTIQWKNKEALALSDITTAEIRSSKLSIRRKGKMLDAISAPSHKVPNVLLLLENMEQLGVAKSDAPKIDPLARVR